MDRLGISRRPAGLFVELQRSVGVSPEEFAAAWGADPYGPDSGEAWVEAAPKDPWTVARKFVVIPLPQDVMPAAVYNAVYQVVRRAAGDRAIPETAATEYNLQNGRRVILVGGGVRSRAD
jgi:hypothetical protein